MGRKNFSRGSTSRIPREVGQESYRGRPPGSSASVVRPSIPSRSAGKLIALSFGKFPPNTAETNESSLSIAVDERRSMHTLSRVDDLRVLKGFQKLNVLFHLTTHFDIIYRVVTERLESYKE